jgi:citrate synthase
MFLGPLAAILMSPGQAGDQTENVRSVSGVVRHPLNFDNLAFGKAFALARSLGLDQFNWRSNPYTTKLR